MAVLTIIARVFVVWLILVEASFWIGLPVVLAVLAGRWVYRSLRHLR